jgi:protein SCO1/2
MIFMTRILAALALFLGAATAQAISPEPAAPVPGDSVYQLDAMLTDQSGHQIKLADLRGRPVLIAMFYTSCKYVCPLIVDAMVRVERALGDVEKKDVRFVLVSFDADHDTPQTLAEIATQRHLDASRWTLTRTDAASVRKLAAVLGVQYRATSDGGFNHSSVVSLLDRRGRIVARSTRMSEADAELLQSVRREIADTQSAQR